MSKNIVETIDNLGTCRINEIFELLAPLLPISARKDGTVSIKPAYQSQETIFFASAYGKQAENYQKEKFQTINPAFTATYYEVWAPLNARERFLYKSYFHLYKLFEEGDEIDEKDYIWLHCDPNEKDKTHSPYKETPHMHVMRHDEAMSHAHIGLHLYKANELLESRETITYAISSALEMISKQLIK